MSEPSARRLCGIDTVALERLHRFLEETPIEDQRRLFSAAELEDAGAGAARVARLAARFAAKEACLKLFPRETALGLLAPEDFSVARDGYGAPRVVCSERAETVLGRHRLAGISLSLSHDERGASAVAIAESRPTPVGLAGRLLWRLLPLRRRVVLENLRRAFGDDVDDAEIRRLAQAHWQHLFRVLLEVGRDLLLPASWRRPVRLENVEAILRASAMNKGVLVLTGHFGNWEVTTTTGIAQMPEYRGRIHFLRRPLRPAPLDRLVTRRFRRAGLGVLPKKGALDTILDRMAENDAVVFVLDQHAGARDGVRVSFFGHPAWTFRSLALLALSGDAPVVPAASWREPGGEHVLRFEEPILPIRCDDPGEEIRRNTQRYNDALERLIVRHPEQWFWVHRRWKER